MKASANCYAAIAGFILMLTGSSLAMPSQAPSGTGSSRADTAPAETVNSISRQSRADTGCTRHSDAKKVPSGNFHDPIGFDEYPVGTSISDQYKNRGIIFGGDSPFISGDTSSSSAPVLSGTPQFMGSIEGTFVDPKDGSPVYVTQFEFDAGYFDELHSTKINWEAGADKSGCFLQFGPVDNTETSFQHFVFSAFNGKAISGIHHFKIKIEGKEDNGFEIDNLSFPKFGVPCGDSRDKMTAEYKQYGNFLTPACGDFTNSASGLYDYKQLTTKDTDANGIREPWALIRRPLIAPAYAGYGLSAWAKFIGEKRQLNSGYRSPEHNALKGGVPQSQHTFGDAADLDVVGKGQDKQEDYKALRVAAGMANADYIEKPSEACHMDCVHADWRSTPDRFAN